MTDKIGGYWVNLYNQGKYRIYSSIPKLKHFPKELFNIPIQDVTTKDLELYLSLHDPISIIDNVNYEIITLELEKRKNNGTSNNK